MECRIKKVSSVCHCLPWFIPRTSENDPQFCGKVGLQCFTKELEKTFKMSKITCEHCKDDCQMNHWYSSLERQPFQKVENREKKLFHRPTSSGYLSKYLIDPDNVFTDEFSRNLTMFTYGIRSKEHFAEERFRRDISICNFFFDTPLITEIKQEVKTTIFDMISAVGGTIALFTGVSVITLVELGWWMWKLTIAMIRKFRRTAHPLSKAYRFTNFVNRPRHEGNIRRGR